MDCTWSSARCAKVPTESSTQPQFNVPNQQQPGIQQTWQHAGFGQMPMTPQGSVGIQLESPSSPGSQYFGGARSPSNKAPSQAEDRRTERAMVSDFLILTQEEFD